MWLFNLPLCRTPGGCPEFAGWSLCRECWEYNFGLNCEVLGEVVTGLGQLNTVPARCLGSSYPRFGFKLSQVWVQLIPGLGSSYPRFGLIIVLPEVQSPWDASEYTAPLLTRLTHRGGVDEGHQLLCVLGWKSWLSCDSSG
jgi:hypothetical protein